MQLSWSAKEGAYEMGEVVPAPNRDFRPHTAPGTRRRPAQDVRLSVWLCERHLVHGLLSRERHRFAALGGGPEGVPEAGPGTPVRADARQGHARIRGGTSLA